MYIQTFSNNGAVYHSSYEKNNDNNRDILVVFTFKNFNHILPNLEKNHIPDNSMNRRENVPKLDRHPSNLFMWYGKVRKKSLLFLYPGEENIS